MDARETQALIQMCRLRFRSFSEAADTVLAVLAEVLPGTLVLAREEADRDGMRVIGAAGEPADGLRAGSMLAVTGDEIDRHALAEQGFASVTSLPLELVDGRIVGALVALSRDSGAHDGASIAMLGIGARMLSFEWESVERRAELGRLRSRMPHTPGVDPETSLPERAHFLELLDHDWQLARRGTIEAVVVGFEIASSGMASADAGNGNGGAAVSGPSDRLALKLAAETLTGSVRGTDRVARVDGSTLAVGLLGCRLDQADAFIGRFRAAVDRVSRSGNPQIDLGHGAFELAAASSPGEALELAVATARGASDEQPGGELVGLRDDRDRENS